MRSRVTGPMLLGRRLHFILILRFKRVLRVLLTCHLLYARRLVGTAINCLLYTGSVWSYLSSEVLMPLGTLESVGLDCDFSLSTILGDCDKCFKTIFLETDVGLYCSLSLPDKNIDKNQEIWLSFDRIPAHQMPPCCQV